MWSSSGMISLFIDADACLVKQEVYRVAERHALKGAALKVIVISKSPIAAARRHDRLPARGHREI